MANNDIKSYAKEKKVFLWQVADGLHICDMTLMRKLRYELSEDEKSKIYALMDEISERKSA